jgi:hypothetical protein
MVPEPTVLHLPEAQTSPESMLSVLPITLAWIGVVVPVLGLVIWFAIRRRKVMLAQPEEHAFRALGKRMHLRARDMKAVRIFATEHASCKPIAVLMNEQLLAQALSSRSL